MTDNYLFAAAIFFVAYDSVKAKLGKVSGSENQTPVHMTAASVGEVVRLDM